MKVSDFVAAMEQIAPTHLAEQWDNVGLLAGDPDRPITRGILTIDYTNAVAAEARENGCDLVIAYHPPIFDGLKRILAGQPVFDAIQRGVAIYSPHTALDIAQGGTNDMLADVLGLGERRPLRMSLTKATGCKLVVFVPREAADRVADALFQAGAGWIGNYSSCSFRLEGTGTFFPEAGAKPAVGSPGQLERVDEIRLETVLPNDLIEPVIAALRKTHPYEEPAFDLVQLAAPPQGQGQGRIGDLAAPVSRSQIIERIKRELGLSHLLVAGPTDGQAKRLACCAGSCGDLLKDALAQKADLYLTGEMRHHDALKAAGRGMTVLCVLHSNSERAVLSRLAKRINEKLPELLLEVSKVDRDPFSIA